MSELEGEAPEQDLGTTIRQTFSEVIDLNQQIIDLASARDAKLGAIRAKIRNKSTPEEERFVARILLDPSVNTRGPEEIYRTIRFYEDLDREISAHAGETIAWLEPETTIVSRSFHGPDLTKFEYYLNLGILPGDAKLQSQGSSGYTIPVKWAARIRFHYNLDEKLEWDMGIGNTFHFVNEPQFLVSPEISPTPRGLLPYRAHAFPPEIKIPLPVIGNDAVAEILGTNGLADRPEIVAMAQMLMLIEPAA